MGNLFTHVSCNLLETSTQLVPWKNLPVWGPFINCSCLLANTFGRMVYYRVDVGEVSLITVCQRNSLTMLLLKK